MSAPVHLCRYQFQDVDFRRVGTTTDGGTSLSGISEPIETDGGGYWRGDFTNGRTRTKADGLAWRALIESFDGGAIPADIVVCDTFFQPENWAHGHHYDPGAPADALPASGNTYTSSAAALRATSIAIACPDPSQLQAGQIFSIAHPHWGNRAYRIIAWDGTTAKIRPPLREAVTAATPLEFYSPRCRMRYVPQDAANPTNLGKFQTCNITLVEDMRKPA
ncbi:MAG: hypothetical protein P0Y64_16850 [Candidatus Sphingomonas colombiensis]|nr:hypothetical protein [Sphingomonas sp.]WEK42989.1 MAG: hypothetical protein P0Y64_16850 [Sphingomonas sp.]